MHSMHLLFYTDHKWWDRNTTSDLEYTSFSRRSVCRNPLILRISRKDRDYYKNKSKSTIVIILTQKYVVLKGACNREIEEKQRKEERKREYKWWFIIIISISCINKKFKDLIIKLNLLVENLFFIVVLRYIFEHGCRLHY